MRVPKKKCEEVEKVVRKVEGLSNWARPEKDAGTRGPITPCGDSPAKGKWNVTRTDYLLPERVHGEWLLSRREDQAFQLRVEQVRFGGAPSTCAIEDQSMLPLKGKVTSKLGRTIMTGARATGAVESARVPFHGRVETSELGRSISMLRPCRTTSLIILEIDVLDS